MNTVKSQVREVRIGNVPVGGSQPLAIIAGPCVIESEAHTLGLAGQIREIAAKAAVPLIFKASYDKANRTSSASFRGPGPEEGLRILQRVRTELGLPVLTDIHTAEQARVAAEAVDVLQIPAFLCRQTDLLLAAAATGKPVNVKKGQFLAPWDMKNVVAKLEQGGTKQVLLTERGASFGYNNLVSDMRSLVAMREFGCPVIFDATHSVQLPGGQGTTTGGQREYIQPLARAACAVGIDALFVEVHENPDKALSDGPNALPLEWLAGLLDVMKRLDAVARGA